MSKRPVSLALLGAMIFGPAGCVMHRAGIDLPVPRAAADTAAIATIRAADKVYITDVTGVVTVVDIIRIEYPAISGKVVGGQDRLMPMSFDSILRIRTRKAALPETVLMTASVAAGLVLGAAFGWYILTCDRNSLFC